MKEEAKKLAEKILQMKPGTEERQAVGYEALKMIEKARQSLPIEAAKEISAMQAASLCRYDSIDKCRRVYVEETICEKCIRSWLISKAKKELKREERG